MPHDDAPALRRALADVGVGDADALALLSEIEWRELPDGEVLIRQGEADEALYVLLHGTLEVLRDSARVATLVPLQLVGEMQRYAGGVRTATLRAAGACRVARLERAAFDRLTAGSPELASRLASFSVRHLHHGRLRAILTTFLGTDDASVLEQVLQGVEWLSLRRGEVVVREGETGSDVFLLVDGRLRAVVGGEAGREVGEVLPGESVGETQLFTGAARNATVFAARDSTLAKLSGADLTGILERFPALCLRLARLAVQRAARIATPHNAPRASVNVALVAGEDGAPVTELVASLLGALAPHGRAAVVDRAAVAGALAQPELCDVPRDDARGARLGAWLSDLEAQQRFLLFVPDRGRTPWSDRCLSQSDIVLTVARAGGVPLPAAGEELFARRWLVLLHGREHRPGGTAAWRKHVPYQRVFHLRDGVAGDLARLARAVAGREVGLVLGGGGARGYAHLGMLRAMEELGIPIDVLGGTSVGACVSGFYAAGKRGAELEATFRRVLAARGDPTLPVVSVLKGRRIFERLREVVGDLDLDDLPLPIFCVASDISGSRMVVLEHGPAAASVMASSSLPAIFPPVNVEGRWMVDGAMVNGVPLDVMRERVGPNGLVVASIVSAGDEARSVSAPLGAQALSGWTWALRKLRGSLELPVLADVITRAAAAAGDHQLRAAMERGRPDACVYHETGGYNAIDFKAASPLLEKGYATAMAALASFREKVT